MPSIQLKVLSLVPGPELVFVPAAQNMGTTISDLVALTSLSVFIL